MASTNHSIGIDIAYNVNRQGLNQLKQDLAQIKMGLGGDENFDKLSAELQKAYQDASKLQQILDQSWNSKLGQLDLSKVNKGIQQTFGNVQNLKKEFTQNGIGTAGPEAFNRLSSAILNTNIQLKRSSKILDDMAVSMANTVKWGITSSVFNTFTGTLQKAYDYSVDLDKSLNDIRIVTNKSADEMERFAKTANSAAKNLGASTRDYTDAALIYYQQGDEDAVAQAKAEVTLKAANVTGQSGQEVSEQLTSVWNGYKVSAEEAELYIDKLAAVAAATASDLEELSTGMSKVASAANMMGVDVDQLNASLATVISVTRQAPESVGTAFKTIYARMGDIEAGIDTETTLGSYTEQMKEIAGINVLQVNGQLRDMGEVMEEVGTKWSTLSREQQIALSQAMAGTRQYNNLLALFDNWDMYEESLKTSQNAAGTLTAQNEIYKESVEARLQIMRTEAEKTYDILFDEGVVKGFINTITGGLSVINNFLSGLGGGMQTIIGLGGIIATLFNKQIGQGLERQLENLEAAFNNKQGEFLKEQIIKTHAADGDSIGSQALELEVEYQQRILNVKKALTEEEAQELLLKQKELGLLQEQIAGIEQYKDIATEAKEAGYMSFFDTEHLSAEDFSSGIEKIQEDLNFLNEGKDILEDFTTDLSVFQKTYAQEWAKIKETQVQDPGLIPITTDMIQNVQVETHYTQGPKKGDKKKDSTIRRNKETEKIKLKEQKILQTINKLEEKGAKLAEAKKNLVEKHELTEKDIKDILDAQVDVRKEQQKLLGKMKDGSKGLADVESGHLDELEQEKEARQAILDQMLMQKERAMAISNLMATFSSLTTSITAVTGLAKAFAQGELTFGQFVSTVVGSLPSIITGLKAMNAIQQQFNTTKAVTNALKAVEGKTDAANLITATAAQLLKETGIKMTEKEIAQRLVNTGAITAEQAAEAGLTVAKTAEAGSSWLATAAQWALNTAVYGFPVMWIVAAIMAAVAAIAILVAANAKAAKEQREANTASIESANAKQEEINKNLELYDSYLKLHKAYEEDASKKQEMIEAADALGDLIDQELIRVAKLTDNYDLLTEAVQAAKEAALDEKEESVGIELSAAKSNLEKTMVKGEGRTKGEGGKYVVDFNQGVSDNDNDDKAQDILAEYVDTFHRDGNKFIIDDKNDMEAVVRQYDQMQEAFIEMQAQGISTESELYKETRDYLEKMKEDVEIYKAAVDDANKTKIEKVLYDKDNENYIDFNNIESDQDFKNKQDELVEYLATLEGFGDKSQKELEQIAQMYIKGVSSSADEYLDRLALINNMTKKVMDADTGNDPKWWNFWGRYKDREGQKAEAKEMEAALRSLSTEELTSISALDENQLNMHLAAFTSDGTSVAEAIKQIAQAYSDASKESIILTNATKEQLEELDVSEDAFKRYAEHIMNTTEGLEDNAAAAQKLALRNITMNKGLTTLGENWEDWNKTLKNSGPDAIDYHEAMSELGLAMKDILGLEVSNKFMEDHLEDIGKLAEGDTEKLKELQLAATKDYVANMTIIAPEDEIDGVRAKLKDFIDEFNGKEIKMGTSIAELDTSGYIDSLNEMLKKGQITADQANAILGGIGYSPDITMIPVTSEPIKHTYSTTILGKKMSWTVEEQTTMQVPQINAEGTTYTGGANTVNFDNTKKGKQDSNGGGSDPDFEELLKDEKDRYHDINIELKQIENNLEKVKKRQEGLVGKALIDNLAKQYALLNKQIEKTAEKMRIAEGEANELQNALASKGVKFNADGTVANYADAYDKQLAKVNAVINKYNSMSEKQQEKYKETLEKAQEEWEQFLEDLERYDELIAEELPSMMAEIEDMLNEQIELKLEAFEYEVKLRLDLSEAKRDWEEFKADILEGKDLENDPLAAAQVNKNKMDTYFNDEGTGSLQATTTHINKIMEQLAQMDADQVAGVYGETYTYKNSKGEDVTIDYNNRAKALEDLKTYIDENIGGLTEFNELIGDIYGNYVDLLGKIQEGFDKQTEAFETLDSMIQHDMELIKMAYGEEAYDKLSELYDKDLENSKAKLAALSAQVDYWKKEVEDQRAYVETLEEGTDEWWRASEALTAAEESLNGAIDAESQAVLDAMQKVTDKLLFNIDKVFSELNKSVTGGLGLEYASLEWELIGARADDYLDTVNAIYSTQQLQNKYLDAIEKSSNPAHQKKLNDLMEQETKYLREQDKLSQYDLDRANLKYELALKQIALEEAQQNKSKLRLRRDSQGNYTYQYTADNDQVASVQQEINDLYNQLYNLDADQYRGNLEKIYDVWAEAQEKMREAAQINDPKVRAEYEELITKEYGDRINALTEENETIKSNLYQSTMSQLLELYNTDTANYDQMTQEQKDILDKYITEETELNGAAFDNLFGLYNENITELQSMVDEEKDILMTGLVPQWNSAYQNMLDTIVGEGGFQNTLGEAFKTIMEQAQAAFEELEKYETEYSERSEDNKTYITDQLTSAEKLLQMYKEDLPEIKSLISGLAEAWDEVTKSIGLATDAANTYYTTTQEQNADDAADEDPVGDNEGGNEPSGQNEGGNTGGNTGGNNQTQDLASNGAPFIATYKVKNGDTLSGIGAKYGVAWKRIYAENKGVIGSNPNLIYAGQKLKIPKYASGGYTGDWTGNGGQLAMLHKKELVLNAHDTDNMLNAITILRDITANLGATLLNRMASISAGGIGTLGAAGAAAGLEQMVTINAEFPNVTNSREIEDAINNLVNRASQHISK